PSLTTAKGGPYGWDALTYLCFSRYLRLDKERGEGVLAAAKALLDAGANANTGWWEENTGEDRAFWESAIYGAAGVAQHAGLTKLLLERGANPNDEETPYHIPETKDESVLRVVLESGKMDAESMTTMLLRKADWHDREGMRMLLEAGADPNRLTRWRNTALHQAIRRDNALENIELMLQYGADFSVVTTRDNMTAFALAARRGRGDVLRLLASRGIPLSLEGVERLIAACALGDETDAQSLVAAHPEWRAAFLAQGGTFLAEFAGTGNADGVRLLLDLGVSVDARYGGDGFFDIAKESTALHVAAWKAWPRVVKLLIERGADVDAHDARGRSALMLAVKACVDSYWTYRRSPESVEALLDAGASRAGIHLPSGYTEVDALLSGAT
ncbi:MAG: ankyrin repeat domain-containing protein, partial [Bryobacteraceae bacterium]